jgi:hypothetical protein
MQRHGDGLIVLHSAQSLAQHRLRWRIHRPGRFLHSPSARSVVVSPPIVAVVVVPSEDKVRKAL